MNAPDQSQSAIRNPQSAIPNLPNLWPLGIIAAFILFIAGTATLIVIACSSPNDLVRGDYYEQEIRFQSQIERTQRAQQLNHKANATYDPDNRRIIIRLPPQHVSQLNAGEVQLYRPSHARLDRSLKLQVDDAGQQTIDATELETGLWKVKVTWTTGGVDYFIDQPVVVQARRS